MVVDGVVVVLAACLVLSIAGLVFVVVSVGKDAVAGTGLGALNTALVGLLVWRVQHLRNGG